MTVDTLHYLFGTLSGGLVGFVLGLVGGGGSILAVPLMVYLVGVRDPHVAIGTSALAVAINAAAGVVSHWRAGNVKWRCASVFAAAGVGGAALGSALGKALDGQKLLFLFAIVMVVVGIVMIRRRGATGDPAVRLGRENARQLVAFGAGRGLLLWLLRYRRRVSHRSRPDCGDGHANAQRSRFVADRGDGVRRHDSRELCAVRPYRLDARWSVHSRWRRRDGIGFDGRQTTLRTPWHA